MNVRVLMLGGSMLLASTVLTAGFEISSDQQIDGAVPQVVGVQASVPGDNTVIPSGSSPNWNYNWADGAGDGSSNAVATAGLSLGTNRLYCAVASDAQGTITLNLAGGSITGSDGLGLTTYSAAGYSDNLVISNVGSVAMGGIDTHGIHSGSDYSTYAGFIRIGSVSQRAGPVRVGYLHTFSGSSRSGANSVAIYSSGSVLIQNSVGSPGDIDASAAAMSSGNITVDHAGEFKARDLLAHTTGSSSASKAGDVIVDGGNSAGDMTVGRIVAYNLKNSTIINSVRPVIQVSRYANVTIGEISAYAVNTVSGGRASDVTITNGITGNIRIDGPVDLSHGSVTNYRGTLSLACGGAVTLASLDLNKVLSASLSSGTKKTEIAGIVTNFDMTYSGGSGTSVDPYVTTQTALRAPAGERIYYAVKNGANAALGGLAYRVADLNGNAGQGGILMAKPARGTVVWLK